MAIVLDEPLSDSTNGAIADLFARQREQAAQSVFANKPLLDPSLYTQEIIGRAEQYETLVRYLADVDQGYLPPLIQVYGPTGSGKTTVVRQVAEQAAVEFAQLRVVYVNLKECHSLYAVANRIFSSVTGSSEAPVWGLDGVFEALWAATQDKPYLLLVLDEVDAVFGMDRYNPSDFVYRLVRHRNAGDPPVVGLITITNRLLGLESNLDSRVRSSMGSQSVFFPAYDREALLEILRAREGAFHPDRLKEDVLPECAKLVSEEHGDARRALHLLRIAGELADRGRHPKVAVNHVWWAQTEAEGERTEEVIRSLPDHEALILDALTEFLGYERGTGYLGRRPEPLRVATAEELFTKYRARCLDWGLEPRHRRRFIDFLDNLEMHDLVESLVQSSGRYGRRRLVWVKADFDLVRRATLSALRKRHPGKPDSEQPGAGVTRTGDGFGPTPMPAPVTVPKPVAKASGRNDPVPPPESVPQTKPAERTVSKAPTDAAALAKLPNHELVVLEVVSSLQKGSASTSVPLDRVYERYVDSCAILGPLVPEPREAFEARLTTLETLGLISSARASSDAGGPRISVSIVGDPSTLYLSCWGVLLTRFSLKKIMSKLTRNLKAAEVGKGKVAQVPKNLAKDIPP